MDERQVAELFRDAASDAPPPSFDVDDVAAASARASARQRSAVLAGSALGMAVLVGGVVVGTGMLRGDGQGDAASLAAPQTTTKHKMDTKDSPGQERGGPEQNAPTNSPKQGGDKSGRVGPRTDHTPRGCAQVDRELAVALAGELPATVHDSNPGRLRCPEGARSAGFRVRVDGKIGTVSALLLPPGAPVGEPWTGAAPDSRHAQHPARDGGTVIVLSEPAPGATDAPYAPRLAAIARSLATHF